MLVAPCSHNLVVSREITMVNIHVILGWKPDSSWQIPKLAWFLRWMTASGATDPAVVAAATSTSPRTTAPQTVVTKLKLEHNLEPVTHKDH